MTVLKVILYVILCFVFIIFTCSLPDIAAAKQIPFSLVVTIIGLVVAAFVALFYLISKIGKKKVSRAKVLTVRNEPYFFINNFLAHPLEQLGNSLYNEDR